MIGSINLKFGWEMSSEEKLNHTKEGAFSFIICNH